MRRGLALVFAFVLVLSFISAGWIGDFFGKLTGNIPLENSYILEDCEACFENGFDFFCIDDQECYDDYYYDSCSNPIESYGDCSSGDQEYDIIEHDPDDACEETCILIDYECGIYNQGDCYLDCGDCEELDYGSCNPVIHQCFVDCEGNNLEDTNCLEEDAELSCSNSLLTCCSNNNDCNYLGSCYESKSYLSGDSGDYCYNGKWYASAIAAPDHCGDGECNNGENHITCPQDECEPECESNNDCPIDECNLWYCTTNPSYWGYCDNTSENYIKLSGNPCEGDGICDNGICTHFECSENSDCDDNDFNTKNICNFSGPYESECSYPPITECISGDGPCPDGCSIINDLDCSINCGNKKYDDGETCYNCPGDVPCGESAECDPIEEACFVVYDFSYDISISERITFADEATEKEEIQEVVEGITAEKGVNFTVDILDSLPDGYEVPKGEKVVMILNISPNKEINASLDFTLEENLFDNPISNAKIYRENNDKTWENLAKTGSLADDSDSSNKVYRYSVYTDHFSIFIITEPFYCGNGKFDEGEEVCDESISGVEGCLNCLCKVGFDPDLNGGCFESLGGKGCSTPGDENCSGYTYYNCSEDKIWVGQGVIIGKCNVECVYGDSDCEGEIPKECDSTYKWDLKEKVSGLCGYTAPITQRAQTNNYDVDDPCEDGNCVSNDQENSLEKDTPSWVGWFIAGLITLIVAVAFTLLKLHNRLENE